MPKDIFKWLQIADITQKSNLSTRKKNRNEERQAWQ